MPPAPLADLLARIAHVAHTHEFQPSRDLPVYQSAQRNPDLPILTAGSLEASVCCFGRDLGKDEVKHAQPLIGAAGKRVRSAIHELRHADAADDLPPGYSISMRDILFTNTVPYKPAENKEFKPATKEAFRPFVAELLVSYWTGHLLMPLGNGALDWFRPYDPAEVDRLAQLPAEERFTSQGRVTVTAHVEGDRRDKVITLLPLPHPSPISSYMKRFPEWLEGRLRQIYAGVAQPDLDTKRLIS